MDSRRARKILLRCLVLRCPDCGEAGIYQAPLQVKHHCTVCGLVFQREQGYFTGALYINLLVTEFSVLLAFLICLLLNVENTDRMFALLIGVGALMPLLFFHHSRSFWLGFDHFIDPIQNRVAPPTPGLGLRL
jgi:uncharacterized protein (DUF983 family)